VSSWCKRCGGPLANGTCENCTRAPAHLTPEPILKIVDKILHTRSSVRAIFKDFVIRGCSFQKLSTDSPSLALAPATE
jgi:hypothetical protein